MTLENWKNGFCLTFYTFAMEIFWMVQGTAAVKLWTRVAFCHSLTLHCCEMHLWNLVLSPTQLWETLTQKPDNPCKLTQIIQCNGFRILSQVLINVSFRQYWIQLYFLTLLHALIGSLEYFQSFESGENGKMIDVEERTLGRCWECQHFTIWAFSPKTLKFNIWRFKFVSNGKIRILCFRLLAWESDTPQSVNFKSIDWK